MTKVTMLLRRSLKDIHYMQFIFISKIKIKIKKRPDFKHDIVIQNELYLIKNTNSNVNFPTKQIFYSGFFHTSLSNTEHMKQLNDSINNRCWKYVLCVSTSVLEADL